jgi:hypothetical protein
MHRKENTVSKPKTPKLQISHKFSTTKVPGLLTQAQGVFTDMGAAAGVFTNPPVSLATLKQSIDNLTTSAAAAMDGGKKNIAQRNRDRKVLEDDLTLLGAYALKVADDDPATLTMSGFIPAPPRARPTPQPLAQPTVLSIEQGVSGQLLAFITPIKKAHSYDVRYAALVNGVPAAWITVTVTQAKQPISVTGLTPGTTYAFQVCALGKAGRTDYSDSVTRMAI